MQTDIEARIEANTHAMVAALRDGTFSAWLHTTEDSIKSSKTDNGPRMAVKNATLLVRFAAQQDIEHPLVQSYMGGSSGPNADNDFNSLKAIANAIVKKHATRFTAPNGDEKVDFATTTAAVIQEAVAWLSPADDEATPTTTTTTADGIDFGDASEPAVDFGDLADPPEDDDDDDDDDDDTLTVRSVVFDSLDNATFATIQSVTDEDIDSAIEWLYKVNAGGMGYKMTLGGAKQVNPTTFTGANNNGPKTWSKWGQVAAAVADILRIAPKRKVKRDDKSFNRGWFAELVSTNNDADRTKKRILLKVFAAVVIKSERNFYNRRLAWSVSDDFAAELRAVVGVNTELMESAPIGSTTGAKSWSWPLAKNDWSPNKTGKVTNADIDNMSLSDLMNL